MATDILTYTSVIKPVVSELTGVQKPFAKNTIIAQH